MDRVLVYPSSIPQDSDLLDTNKGAMIADGALARAVLGTSTVVDGLICTPTSPPSLAVVIGEGSISAFGVVDQSAYGSVGIDTAPLVKLGISKTAQTINLAAPTIAGTSIIYLIQAAYSEVDSAPVTLPYYNAAAPSQPLLGAAGSGVAQNTRRRQTVAVAVKASVASSNPAQPPADTGYTPLYYVTVPYGQTSIAASAIVAAASPTITYKLPALSSSVNYAIGQAGIVPNPTDNTQLWAAIQHANAGLQGALGFVPVQQGNSSTISLSWDGTAIAVTAAGVARGELAGRDWVTAGFQPLGSYQPAGNYVPGPASAWQPALGFAPVQQSGGSGQLGSKIYLGWNGSALNCQVDGNTTAVGNIASQAWVESWVDTNFPARGEFPFTQPGGTTVVKFPNGWTIMTFGWSVNGGTTQPAIPFPNAFANECNGVIVSIAAGTVQNPSVTAGASPNDKYSCSISVSFENGSTNYNGIAYAWGY